MGSCPAQATAVGGSLACLHQREGGRAVAKKIKERESQPKTMVNFIQCSTWEDLRKNVFALCGAVPYVPGSVFDMFAREKGVTPQQCYDLIASWRRQAEIAVRKSGNIFTELDVPEGTPRKALASHLRKVMLTFHPTRFRTK